MPNGWLSPSRNMVLVLSYAVAIGSRNSVMRLALSADRVGTPHGAGHGVIEQLRIVVRATPRRLGDQHIPGRQHVNPAWMLETRREGIDLEPGRGDRLFPSVPSLGGRHLEGWEAALRFRRRHAGLLPKAAAGAPSVTVRTATVVAPTNATPRARLCSKNSTTTPRDGIFRETLSHVAVPIATWMTIGDFLRGEFRGSCQEYRVGARGVDAPLSGRGQGLTMAVGHLRLWLGKMGAAI